MERLTVTEVQQIKAEWDSPYMCRPNDFWENRINSLFGTIEAQQQEIEQHIKWNEAHTKARVEQAELIDKLVRDKDEQAGRIMKLEDGFKKQRNFLQLLNELGGLGYQKHGWIKSHIAEIDTLVGGGEDGSSKDE